MELENLTIKKASELLDKKEISAVELTEAYLDRIKNVDSKVSAYLLMTEKEALASAKDTDKRISSGKRIGALDGIPAAIKDNLNTKGIRTTAASKILENYLPPYDATVITKLKNAGLVMLGKTNMDEFAMGSSTENSAYGPTHNPWDLERVPGGSSGGSAAAMAADECLYALGSDTGGSIRQPASLCGVLGLKPTYGRVSRYGLLAMGSSLDQIGAFTKTAEDMAIVLETIAGKDKSDATSREMNEKFSELVNKEPKKLKLAILDASDAKEAFGKDLEMPLVYNEAMSILSGQFGDLRPEKLSNLKYALAVYYIIMASEVSSNLERFDGIRYGLSDRSGQNLIDIYFDSRAKGFGAEVKRRIMLGAYSLSSGFYDAYYKKASKVRQLIKNEFDKIFSENDFLIMPTSPTTAFKIGEKMEDPLTMYLSDIYTITINLAGIPAISVPCGFDEAGLPVSFQIVGPHWSEAKMLQLANAYEKMTAEEEWRKRKPKL